jgi:hypothetical protein
MNINKVKILHKEYSSYRCDIVEYLVKEIIPYAKSFLDPMSGTAPLIPYLYGNIEKAYFNDLIPLHKHINAAKTYEIYKGITKLTNAHPQLIKKELQRCLKGLERKQLIISDDWIPDSVLEILSRAWLQTKNYDIPISIFMKAIILLCVRPFSSISRSEKNATWYRPGGMSTHLDLDEILAVNINKYTDYYTYFYAAMKTGGRAQFAFSSGDAVDLKLKEKVDLIITSPPYANRYDCTRMFAPELYFLSNIDEGEDISILKKDILASNVVTDFIGFDQELIFIKKISPKTFEFLINVEKKKREKEKSYYLRYFTKYYLKLFRTFDNLLSFLHRDGKMYIVVQNNIHRGELNATDDFIIDFFQKKGLIANKAMSKLRSHQGRRNISSLHPLVLKKHIETIIEVHK